MQRASSALRQKLIARWKRRGGRPTTPTSHKLVSIIRGDVVTGLRLPHLTLVKTLLFRHPLVRHFSFQLIYIFSARFLFLRDYYFLLSPIYTFTAFIRVSNNLMRCARHIETRVVQLQNKRQNCNVRYKFDQFPFVPLSIHREFCPAIPPNVAEGDLPPPTGTMSAGICPIR